jgi:hypothetical protein
VAMQSENRALLRAVNRALAAMKTDGTLAALVARWLAGTTDHTSLQPAAAHACAVAELAGRGRLWYNT